MKKAITRDNILILKNKINEFISYIKSLKMQNISVLQSNRKTGFIGFIIDLQNSIAVAEKLFNENTIEFLSTYKLSQDHIETWFAQIKRMNGWNNNPSAKQFQSSFRKILYSKKCLFLQVQIVFHKTTLYYLTFNHLMCLQEMNKKLMKIVSNTKQNNILKMFLWIMIILSKTIGVLLNILQK